MDFSALKGTGGDDKLRGDTRTHWGGWVEAVKTGDTNRSVNVGDGGRSRLFRLLELLELLLREVREEDV